MKWLIALVLFPSACLADSFAGKWLITTQVTSDNCYGSFGKINTSITKIKVKNGVVSYKRNDGSLVKGIVSKSKSFSMRLKYDRVVDGAIYPTALLYQFKNIKNSVAEFVFSARVLDNGFDCYIQEDGKVSKL